MNITKRAFLILLVLATALTLLVGVAGCKPKPPEFVSQGEEAVYYCLSQNGEDTVELKQGQFTLNIAGDSKTGSYTFDKTKGELVLDMGDSTLIQAQLNLAKGELKIRYGNKNYVMIKKVNFTVTFDTLGGSQVASQSVVNGGLVSKPTDPTKTQYVFTGWYKDANLTQAFDFFADRVYQDTTLYARYILDDPNANKFDVILVDGDQVFATVQTIGGYLVNLPQPTNANKTFLGWWYSDADDAQKLTRKYDDTQKIYQNTSLFAVWQEDCDIAVNYIDGKVYWSGIDASRYTYVLGQVTADGVQTISSTPLSDTTANVDLTSLEAGEYEITILAEGKVGKAYFYHKVLHKVSLFKVVGNDLIFNKVDNATDYLISIVCGDKTHSHELQSLNGSSTYSFANCQIATGGYEFTVTAVAEGYVSSVSKTFVYDRQLPQVNNLVYDEDTQVVSWDNVDQATAYLVKITANGNTTTQTVYTNSVKVDGISGNVSVKVSPVAFGYNATAQSVSYVNNKLATPTNVKILGNVISWDVVKYATGYVVKVGNQEYTTTTNSFDMTEHFVDGQTQYTISVKAKASDAQNDSIYCAPVDAKYGVMGNVNYVDNYLCWEGVFGAKAYQVVVNEGDEKEILIDIQDGSLRTVINFNRAGNNLIKVYAIDQNDTKSTPVSITVVTYEILLDFGHDFEDDAIYKAVGDTYVLPSPTVDGYDFNGWYTASDVNNAMPVQQSGVLTQAQGFTAYASWSKQKYVVTLDLDGVGGLNDGDSYTHQMTYDEDFVLPVPYNSDLLYVFIGWYEYPNGLGMRYTDEKGNSVTKYTAQTDKTLYPRWEQVITFVPEFNPVTNSYDIVSVKALEEMKYVTEVTIPEYYDGKLTYEEKYLDDEGNEQKRMTTESKVWRVTSLGPSAFLNQKNLQKVFIPSTIELVSWGGNKGSNFAPSAFAGCDSLKSIFVYDVNDITKEMDMQNAYKYWSKDGVLFINDPTTMQVEIVCYPVAKPDLAYNIPYGVNVIPQYTFNGALFTTVTVPCSVASLGASAFSSCRHLTTIEFLDAQSGEISATTLSLNEGDTFHAAIYDCTQLEFVRFPLRLAQFSEAAIIGCSRLSTIIIGQDGQRGDVYMSKAVYDENNKMIGSVVLDKLGTTLLFVPRGFMGEEVYEDGVYVGRALKIPQGVQTIAPYAFGAKIADRAARANIVYVPDTVTLIETSAFANCGALVNVIFQGTKDSYDLVIKTEAFINCSALKDLSLPENLTTIERCAFAGTVSLSTVYLNANRDSVQYAQQSFGTKTYYAYDSVCYVREVYLGENFPQINFTDVFGINTLKRVYVAENSKHYNIDSDGVVFDNAMTRVMFFPKDKLEEYTIPHGVMGIEKYVFKDADLLQKITIPNTMQQIGLYAFEDCDKLSQVVFVTGGSNNLYIGESAFSNCKVLDNVTIVARTLTIYKNAFYGCSNLKTLEFEERIGTAKALTIGYMAFANTDVTGDIVLPRGLTTIENMAFLNCANLTSVTLPTTVSRIGAYATYKVYDVYRRASSTKSILTDISVFTNCTSLQNIHVAEGNAYYASVGGVLFAKEHTQVNVGYSVGEKYVTQDNYFVPQVEVVDGNYYSSSVNTVKVLLVCPVKNQGVNGVLQIPNTVMALWYSAFRDNEGIKEVSFSDVQLDNDWDNGLYIGGKAFYNSTTIQKITLPRGLTAITSQLFYNCTALEEIFIPNTVQTIQQQAFYNCTSLTDVIFEDATQDSNYELELADCNANSAIFAGCVGLTQLVLPKRTTVIGQYALSLGSFTTVTLPSTLREIKSQAFYYNTQIQQVIFNGALDGDLKIYEYAFFGASNLRQIDIPQGTTHIGYNAFANCINVATLNFPQTLIDLGGYYSNTELALNGYACYNMTNLTTVTFAPSSQLQQIAPFTFANCTSLQSIVIPFGVTKIGAKAFSNTSSLTTIIFEHVDGLSKVGAIDDYAMEYSAVNSFEFPTIAEGQLDLGVALFRGCTQLTYVYFSQNVVDIYDLFRGCYSVTTLEVSQSNPEFREHAPREGEQKLPLLTDATGTVVKLAYGSAPEQLIIPDNFTTIGAYAFLSQATLKNILLPSTLTTIEPYAFAYATGLQQVKFANDVSNLKSISEGAFIGTLSLVTFNIPTQVEGFAISTLAFSNSGIRYIDIPQNVVSIGARAFEWTANLEEITFSSNNERVYGAYLLKNSAIQKITFSGSLGDTWAEGVFAYSTNLHTVVFNGDDAFLKIPNYAFQYCYSLKNVDLSPLTSLRALGKYSFAYTGLEEFTVPTKVEYLTYDGTNNTSAKEAYIFSNSTQLKTVYISANTKVIAEGVFHNCTSLTTVTSVKPTEGQELVQGATMPNTLTRLGKRVFENTAIKKLVLGSNLSTIVSNSSGVLLAPQLETIEFAYNTVLTSIPEGFAMNCYSLKNINLSNLPNVGFIGPNAFSSTAIQSINIPSKVKQLGGNSSTTSVVYNTKSSVFENCQNLTTVDIGNVTKLGQKAFKNCPNLTTLTANGGAIENGMTQLVVIGTQAFYNTGFTKVEFGQGLSDAGKTTSDYFGMQVFAECQNLQEVVVQKGARTILGHYYSSNNNVDGVITDKDYEAITTKPDSYLYGMFNNCTKLTKVTIPDNITRVGIMAFIGCTSLRDISFLDASKSQLSYIHPRAFENTGVVEVDLTDYLKLVQINHSAFRNCDNLTQVKLPVNGSTAIVVANYGFYDCAQLQSVNLQDSKLSAISLSCFENCVNLKSATLPKTLETIDKYAFKNCTMLKSVDMSNTQVVTIPTETFSGCTNLETAKLPQMVTEIGIRAFYDCKSLKNFDFPDKLVRIQNFAFFNCESLTEIDLEVNYDFTTLGESAFENCVSIVDIKFPTSAPLLTIGTQTFANLYSLATLNLPSYITTIQYRAFQNATSLTYFEIPASVKTINSGAFGGATSLKTFTVASGNPNYTVGPQGELIRTSNAGTILYAVPAGFSGEYVLDMSLFTLESQPIFDAVFAGCDKITSVVLPQGMTTIYHNMFEGAVLQTVKIPDTVTMIDYQAFANSTIEYIDLPESLTRINGFVFRNTQNLKSLTIPQNVTILGEGFLQGSAIEEVYFNAIAGQAADERGDDTEYSGNWLDGTPNIKKFIIGEGVQMLSGPVFYHLNGVTVDVVFPSTLKTIGTFASSCSNCTFNVTFAEGLERINYGFMWYWDAYNANKRNYDYINYGSGGSFAPNNYNPIRMGFIAGNSVVQTRGVQTHAYAPTDMTQFNTLNVNTWPSTLEYIGTHAFNHVRVNNMDLSHTNITQLDNNALNYVYTDQIILPNTLTTMGREVFLCANANRVVLPSSVTSIGAYDKNAKVYRDGTFAFSNIGEVVYQEGFTKLHPTTEEVFGENEGAYVGATIGKIILPESLVEISSYLFANLGHTVAMEYLALPTNLSVIGADAFAYAHINNLYVNSNLDELKYETVGKVCWTAKADYSIVIENEHNIGTFAGWTESQTIYVTTAQDNFIFVADRALSYVNPYSDALNGFDLDCKANVVYNYDINKVPGYENKQR